MGMNSYIKGIKAPTPEFLKMYAVWKSCYEAGIDPPDSVTEFFEDEEPNESGILVNLADTDCCQEYSADMENGCDIEIAKLPEGVTHIRFYNAY